jgi:hypothetical protein
MVRYIHLTKSLHAEKNTFLYKVAEAFALLLLLAWLLANKIESPAIYTTACFLSYIKNHQQTAAHNVVVNKFNCIEEILCELRDKLKWFKPHNYQTSSPPKSYEGNVLTLWNEFKNSLMQRENSMTLAWPTASLPCKFAIVLTCLLYYYYYYYY